jgi:hypothetical protein
MFRTSSKEHLKDTTLYVAAAVVATTHYGDLGVAVSSGPGAGSCDVWRQYHTPMKMMSTEPMARQDTRMVTFSVLIPLFLLRYSTSNGLTTSVRHDDDQVEVSGASAHDAVVWLGRFEKDLPGSACVVLQCAVFSPKLANFSMTPESEPVSCIVPTTSHLP